MARLFADALTFAGHDPVGLIDDLNEDPKEPTAVPIAVPVPETPVAKAVLPFCLRFALPDVPSLANHNSAAPFVAIPDTPATKIVLPLCFRLSRSKRVENEDEKPEAVGVAVANPALVMLLPNPDAEPVPEAAAKQTHVPLPPLLNPTVQAEAGTLRSGELAFAAKLTPTPASELRDAPKPILKNPEPASVRPEPPVNRVAAPEAIPVPSTQHSVAQPQRQTAEPEHKTETRETPHPVEDMPEASLEATPGKAAEGLRDISFRLVDGSKEKVEVRLLERAGELRVSVRSADPQLNTELR
ncbi:MAG: hypothetical protein M3Z85_18615, partial [Acidobacteriota bacterium]|nr:hypothetical protein [Acidobacteriota bacterium]